MALATVSLASTTFTTTAEPGDTLVNLASTSGITPDVRLYVDREMLAVVRLTGIGTQAIVRRGLDGTAGSRHATNATIYIGRADQFFTSDPGGLPPSETPVYPYINVVTGDIWVPQGDETGADLNGRVWSKITTSLESGALGIRQRVTTTPS